MTNNSLNILANEKEFSASTPENTHKLRAFRQDRLEKLSQIGLPTNRTEKWRFTPIFDLKASSFVSKPLLAIESLDISALRQKIYAENDLLVVLCNGHILYADEVSGFNCTSILDWSHANYETILGRDLDASYPMAFLNSAYLHAGVEISLTETMEYRVHLVHLTPKDSDNLAIMTHNLISIDEGCSCEVIEHFLAEDPEQTYFHNHLTHIDLADQSDLKHYRHQEESQNAYHYSLTVTNLGAHASYKSFTLSTGAKWARNELLTNLTKSHSHCQLDGSYLIKEHQHSDTSSVINHIVPDCTSHQVYKGIIDDHARGVFQGRINVHRDAQHTDGYQLNRALLLSDHAEINSKPELEIFADDVKCSHGATIGEIEEDALFYLKSRGIPEDEARAMLILSFASDAIDNIESEATADYFKYQVERWLGKE